MNILTRDPGKAAWRGHVSRLVGLRNVGQQRGKYRARRQLCRAGDGAVRLPCRSALSAPPRTRYEMVRTSRRRVIIS